MGTEAEIKAFRLHAALAELLARYKNLIRDTSSEPTFGEDDGVIAAERALFENRPDAAWEESNSTDGPADAIEAIRADIREILNR